MELKKIEWWSARDSNPRPTWFIDDIIHRHGMRFSTASSSSEFLAYYPRPRALNSPGSRYHPPGRSTPNNRGNYIARDPSVPRPSPPDPQAARARGAMPLSLASKRHMGFNRDPRAPGPAVNQITTLSKPVAPRNLFPPGSLHNRS